MADQEALIEVRDRMSARMKSLDGSIWKESVGELHVQYNEMPNWILLYEDSDITTVHTAFRRIVEEETKAISGTEVTVVYYLIEGDQLYELLEFFRTREILNAQPVDLVISKVSHYPLSEGSVFMSTNSHRE